jgi:hypothetical protein
MRLTESQVKEAILNPDRDVRDAAVFYFAKAYSTDPGIMPQAIQAIEQYGWKDAFEFYSFLPNLVQSDETVRWLLAQIKKYGGCTDEEDLRFSHALANGLAQADARILEQHRSEILNLDELEDEAKKAINERIEFRSRSAEELWHELEAFCSRGDKLSTVPEDLELSEHLVEALGRNRDFSVPKVLTILTGTPANNWMELCAVRLAGELRLQDAIPAIVALHEEPDDWIFEEGHRALAKIGGDRVVEEFARCYPMAGVDLRSSAASILEDIHSDLSIETCLRLFETEQDHHIRCSLLQSALMNFATDGIQPARQLILTTPLDPDVLEVRSDLLATCKVMGETLPEFEEWNSTAKNDMEFRRNWYRNNVLDVDGFDITDEEVNEPPLDTIVRSGHVGRNDPCPCGSGKKFKKCCLNKGSATI